MQADQAQLKPRSSLERRGRIGIGIFLLCLWSGLFIPAARAANRKDNGKLLILVARSQVHDPFFEQSVVLMLPIEGTPIEVGLILNKTSRVPLSTLFPENPAVAARKEPVRFGGPVDVHVPGMVFYSTTEPDNSLRLYGDVYFIFDADQISALLQTLPASSKMLFFLGRAQWSPQQLQNEIHRGDWDTLHEDGSMILSADPKTLWRKLSTGAGKYIRYEEPSRLSPGRRPSL